LLYIILDWGVSFFPIVYITYKEMSLTKFELHHLLVQFTVITDLQLFLRI